MSSNKPGSETRCATAHVTTTFVLPPEALTVVMAPPDLVSQKNVERVLGLPEGTYLELLRRPDCSINVTPIGKLRVVSRVEFLAWLRVLPRKPPTDPAPEEGSTSIEDLAKEFDLKPSPTTRTRRRR